FERCRDTITESLAKIRRGDDEHAAAGDDVIADEIEKIAADVDGIGGGLLLNDDERRHRFSIMPSSPNCFSSTVDGESHIRSYARASAPPQSVSNVSLFAGEVNG